MTESTRELKDWQNRVRTVGFREAVIRLLKSRLAEEADKARLDMLVRRLAKYEPQLEIVRLLRSNPTWKQRVEELIGELPEVNADPVIQFVFEAAGNVPNTPVVDEGRTYFGSGDRFYALDAESGRLVWQRQRPGERWTAAWLCEDSLYVCSAGTLHALSVSDGSPQWHFQVGKQLTAPYAAAGTVFAGSEEGTLYAADARTGARLWTFNVADAVFVAPALWQGTIFAASRDHTLYAIRSSDGECRWRFTTDGKICACPSVSEGIVYLASEDRRIYALLAASGRLLWSFATGAANHASPAEKDGVVYVGSRDKRLYALRAEDGTELWRHRLLGYPSPAVVRRKMIYVSVQGRLYGLRTRDHSMRWCVPLGASVATAPALGRRRIYAGTLNGKLLCMHLRTPLDEQGATQVIKQFLTGETGTGMQ
jgi:outer membrane protein assembly factor BamB